MEFGHDFIGCGCFIRIRTWIWIWSPGSVSLWHFGSFLPFSLLFCQQVVWDLEDSGPSFVFFSLSPFLIGRFTLFGTPGAKGEVLARDLARCIVWRSGAFRPRQPNAAGMRPVACRPHAEE